ncbi:MAG: PAS domain S-box protein, partial [Gemmataceae bacterium]
MTEINWQELAYTLFEEAGDALFLFDPETEQLEDVNPMAQRLSGYTRHELMRMKVTFLFRAEVQGGLQRLRQAFRRTGLFHSQEGFWLRHQKEGLWIPVNLTITRLHTEPRTLGLITARDIREQRDAHEQLKKIEAELRRVTSSVSDCLWSSEVDSTGRWSYVYFSPVVERISGRPPDAFTTLERWLEIVYPDDRAAVEKNYARFKTGQAGSIEYRLRWPDGTVHWVRDSVMVTRGLNGKSLLLDGVLSDITENKQAYEALRESEARQRVMMDQMPACMWAVDNDLNITLSVGAGLAALGVKPGELVGTKLTAYIGSDDPNNEQLASHLRALRGESVSFDTEWQGVYFRSHIEPLRRHDGSISGCIGVCLDITERMRFARELEKSQRAMATLMSNLPGMAYRCRNDPDWTMEFVSEGTYELTGYHPADLVDNRTTAYGNLIHPDDRDMVWQEVQRALTERRPFRLLYRIFTAAKQEKWVWEQGRAIESDNGELISLEGFVTDITDRKRFEEALHTSEAKYRSLIENLTQAIFLKDRELRIVAVNQPFCQSVGKSA